MFFSSQFPRNRLGRSLSRSAPCLTPYQPDAETPDAGSYASPFASIDLNRTPLAGGLPNIDPPDPANPHLDGGQVLYHMALGAKPEDFHPALQPLAQGYSIAFQPKPEMGPGLLGSLEDIRNSITAGAPDPDGQAGDNDPSKGQEPTEVGIQDIAAKIRQRDIDYWTATTTPSQSTANQYNVHPALPLGLGIESTFGNGGTYRKTGDAFGMTGGSTAHMTHASSPEGKTPGSCSTSMAGKCMASVTMLTLS
ncbi:MAG: hypothetical protein WDN45_07615 [Caulobacteraceae bacterium]